MRKRLFTTYAEGSPEAPALRCRRCRLRRWPSSLELTEHLGHEKNQADPGREATNVRNGRCSKTVISDAAAVADEIAPAAAGGGENQQGR